MHIISTVVLCGMPNGDSNGSLFLNAPLVTMDGASFLPVTGAGPF